MYFLRPYENFPPVEMADQDGLLAVGGDLTVRRLQEAYNRGIFPWYNDSQPVLWWSPDPRMVLFPEKLKISKSMRQLLRKDAFKVTYDTNFSEVIENCATVKREGQPGTWITTEIKEAYTKLHETGMVISAEVWQGSSLAGGLYGVYLREKKLFCGESMFAKVSNASKFGFIKLVEKLKEEGVRLIDCQIYTDHLASLGAEEIPRGKFLEFLK